MKMNCEIENPFIFNCWKHHKGFVCGQIKKFAAAGETSFPVLTGELKKIGESQTDFYYGIFTPSQIAEEIRLILERDGKILRDEFILWLYSGKIHYKIIELTDGSIWTLRLGTDISKYVHFHPGRNSKFNVRIRASTLKSAITAIIWSRIFNVPSCEISTVNQSRMHLLLLPPVKSFSVNKSIRKVIELLEN